MATQKIPLYIPTFINSATYAPARVLPRIYFYNGQVDCEYWWVTNENNAANRQDKFPYFDHYNVVTGSFPTQDSRTLLFNNEAASYGEMPSASLYTTYWDKYVSFLYDPRTRVLNCSAIIPFADYVKLSLNDIVNLRGNYWHLRAINDYSLKTGECNVQLVGPIISDTFNQLQPEPTPPAAPNSASISWTYSESSQDGSFRIYDNGSNKVTATSTSNGNFFVTQSHIVNVEMDPVNFPSSGSVTMSLFVNGDATISSTSNSNTTLTASFTAVGGNSYQLSGSIQWNATLSCCAPTITSIAVNGGNTIGVTFTTGAICNACSYTTIESSTNGTTWGGANTGGCTSPRTITAPTTNTYYRMKMNCGGTDSAYSNTYLFSTGSSSTANVDWSYSITGGATGTMDIYLNGSIVESRSYTSSNTFQVSVGDTINVEINTSGCTGGSGTANAYCTGIINDAACATSVTGLTSYTYTVVSGDIGTTLNLDSFSSCDSGCV